MALTVSDAARLAKLARISLTQDELEYLTPQLDVIMDAVASVSQIATAEVPPTSHAMSLTNVFRTDVVRPSLPVRDALAGAPATEDNQFRVPKIVGESA